MWSMHFKIYLQKFNIYFEMGEYRVQTTYKSLEWVRVARVSIIQYQKKQEQI